MTLDNILLYEKTFKIKCIQNNYQIIFQIEIPLLEISDYTLYQMYSVPVPNNHNSFSMILPRSKFLLLNQQTYAFRDQPCQELQNQLYFCKEDMKTNLGHNNPCEVQLINLQKPGNCVQETVTVAKTSVSKYGSSQYIVVSPQDVKADLKCSNQEKSKILKGTYVITLQPKCQLDVNGQIYTPSQESMEPEHKFYMPVPELPQLKQSPQINLPELELENVPLHNLETIKSQLQAEKQRIPKSLHIPIYHTSIWTIIIYFIIIFIALAALVKYLRSRRQRRSKSNVEEPSQAEIPLRIIGPGGSVLKEGRS